MRASMNRQRRYRQWDLVDLMTTGQRLRRPQRIQQRHFQSGDHCLIAPQAQPSHRERPTGRRAQWASSRNPRRQPGAAAHLHRMDSRERNKTLKQAMTNFDNVQYKNHDSWKIAWYAFRCMAPQVAAPISDENPIFFMRAPLSSFVSATHVVGPQPTIAWRPKRAANRSATH